MSRQFLSTTRECNQLLEGINNELKLTVGGERLHAQKQQTQMELNVQRTAKAEAMAATATSTAPAAPAAEKFVWPALGTPLATHRRKHLQ
mmetsp:Transcript_29888/g.74137  ORF Transcript_29888/g.74137 Transcript_29888/m.74137 type:complete len:90 (-) Transcript_29888:381-650(-)|eukprot:CAMPEP_0197584570 /NCGR_PEP_ID=MMETSP1326-20131121/7147_1 /TAXON_ID=1155430 /ORGANISM="Genus nov. species nov., Strain RCC2288" /LENGTH=89 /DNA_ID=CAMNT_0043148957 /DNA_START=281 /DNA_END=550 /DNA_ORIENTATION=+